MKPTKTHATYADVLDAPAHLRAELIEGNLYLQAKPRGNHQLAAARLAAQLDSTRPSAPERWVILPEIELHIPWTLAPDIAGWRAERFTEPLDSAYFTVVPDWVCEVLSPSTKGYDRGLKRAQYLERGVAHLWLVDPDERLIETFDAHAGAWVLTGTYADDECVHAAPFEAHTVDLARLWRV